MNLYNVMVNYTGEGETNIYIPSIGDTRITNGRPLYLKNASFNVIEALRQFRTMGIVLNIGVTAKGAFKIIDFNELSYKSRTNRVPVQEVKQAVSNEDISSILKAGASGPIPVEVKSEQIKEEIDYAKFVLPSGSYEGKTLEEVDKEGKLKSVYNGFKSRNPQVKEAIEKYYESKVN